MKNLLISLFAALLFLPLTLNGQTIEWEPLFNIPGNPVQTLAGDTSGRMMVQCTTGTFRSYDKGRTWERLNESKGYAVRAGKDGNFFRFTSGLVQRTSDLGTNWQSAGGYRPEIAQIRDIAVDMQGTYWVATDTAVWVSTDYGASYKQSFSFPADSLENFRFTGIETDYDGRVFVLSSYAQLFATQDGGTSWFQAFDPKKMNDSYWPKLQVTQQGVLFVSDNYGGLYRSDDSGLNWKPAKFPFAIVAVQIFIAIEGTSRVLALTGGQYFRSEDGGATFQTYTPTDPVIQYVNSFYSFSRQSVILVSSKGLYYSIDSGGSWTYLEEIFGDVNSIEIAFPKNECQQVVSTTKTNVAFSANSGTTWSVSATPKGPFQMAALPDGSIWFLANGQGYRSIPGDSLVIMPANDLSGQYHTIYCSPQGLLLAGQIGGKLWRSTDYGANWQTQTFSIPSVYFNHFAVHPDGDLYVGTSSQGIYRSSDAGQTWQALPAQAFPWFSYIKALDITPKGTLLALAGYNDDFFRSTDKGEHWEYVKICCSKLFNIVHTPDGTCFLANGADLFRSDDDGQSWQKAGQGGGFLAVSPGGYLFKIGYNEFGSAGLYKSLQPVDECLSTGVQSANPVVSTLVVSPNPMSPGPVNVGIAGLIGAGQLVVSDLAGRVLQTIPLTDGQGLLDCSGWASGLYFYQVMQQDRLMGSGKLFVN